MEVTRFDVFLLNLDPTIGHEIKKLCPMCGDLSGPNESPYFNCHRCPDDNHDPQLPYQGEL